MAGDPQYDYQNVEISTKMDPELSSLSRFGSKNGSAYLNAPPAAFIATIKNEKIIESKSICFILYIMTYTRLSLCLFEKSFQPFELFKDCYSKNKKPQRAQCYLSKYFSLGRLKVTSAESVNDSLEGSTMLLDRSDYQPISEVCIFPQILMFDKNASQFCTLTHVHEYRNRLETVLIKFNSKSLPNLYINWLKLVESYVELIFRDLMVKWCQWLHSVRAARHRRSVQMTLKTLLPAICQKFWQKYFIFQDSTKQHIGRFSSELSRRLPRRERHSSGKSGSKVTFGVWLDSHNGILIFGNGVFCAEGKSLGSTYVIPNMGVCLDQNSPNVVAKKLLLFINLAVVECFMNEIH